MIRKFAVAAAIAAVGLAGQAVAAQPVKLSSVQGSVLVNQNGRFVPAKSATALRAGDRVMATAGSASLKYADGCTVSIAARSMATIGERSPCGGASNVVRVSTQGYGDTDGSDGAGNADLWMYLGFGLLTIGVVGSALSDDETPTSP